MRRILLVGGLVSLALTVGFGTRSHATPMTYTLEAHSTAIVSVNAGSTPLLTSGSVVTSLTGTVTLDLANETVEGFSLAMQPNTMLTFSQPYGGVTSAMIESATIAASDPFAGTSKNLATGMFSFTGNSAEINGLYSVGGLGGLPIGYTGGSITFSVISAESVYVMGANLGAIPGHYFIEDEDLAINANLSMFLSNPSTPVPEPRAAVMFLVAMAVLRRR